MAGAGQRFAWSAIKAVVGLALYATAIVLVHLSAHALVPVPFAIVIDVIAMLLVPIAVTRLLLPAFRRAENTSTFLNTFPGLAVVWSMVVLVALAWGARRWVARVLTDAPRMEHDWPAWSTRTIAHVGRWLTPAPLPRVTMPHVATPAFRDAASGSDAAMLSPQDQLDASVLATADAAPARLDAAIAGDELLALDASVCVRILWVRVADLGQGSPDEIIVACDDGVRVFWLRDEPVLYLRTWFRYVVPPELLLEPREPWIADLDGDGRRDIALCAYYTSQRGGTRGGKSWWSAVRADGQFAPPTGLDDGECAAVTSGDVTGDGRPELLVAREGNPWDEHHPDGTLFWYARARSRWQLRGTLRLFPNPLRLFVTDGNHDGIGDVFLTSSDERLDPGAIERWYPGSRQGPIATDAGVPNVQPPPIVDPSGDFDGDHIPDAVSISGLHVRVVTTSPRGGPTVRTVTRSLDYAEYMLASH